jgi:ATP-dependent helicase/DNAse subunit B
VPLTLITGPANAGKAELVFEGLREDLARGGSPWLLVPSAADARYYRRELAGESVALGVRVARFADLSEEIARRAGVGEESIDEVARERILRALVSEAVPRAPAPGYVRELARFVAELERAHVTPRRLHAAVRAWRAAEPAAAAHARPTADVYERYMRALAAADMLDVDSRCARALDALRESPARWCFPGTPQTAVFFYGFDDLTAYELDTIETLGRVVDAPVTLALSYEPGRVAFADRARSFQTLAPWAHAHIAVQPATRHYAPAARRALSHLERHLFEAPGPREDRERVEPGSAIRLLEGGGVRAELELVAQEIRALLDRGVRPGEVALVHRTPELLGTTIAEVLRAHGVPFSLRRRTSFMQTALGRGLLALLRCALLEAGARDLLTWLRTPGVVAQAELVDRLEVRVRSTGARTAEQARTLWEEDRWPLDTLDRVRAEAERGPLALVACVERELWRLFCKPRRGAARELGEHERQDAHAFRAATGALASLRELLETLPHPALLADSSELVGVLEDLTFDTGSTADGHAVPVLGPLELRARRVRALFLCGLQERVFPAPARPPAFLGEHERRSLAEASGLVLESPRDWLARERYLLYACVSRPQELLVLSWHAADDEGNPTARSLFVDDICDLFDARLIERRRRPLGATDALVPALLARDSRPVLRQHPDPLYEPDDATARDLADERVLAPLRGDHVWSASSLGAFACCPVRWLVEHVLRPESLEPESEPLAIGRVMHGVLADVIASLRSEHGSARLDPSRLQRARALAGEALARRCADTPLSVRPEEHAGLLRRMHADLDRYLEHVANEDGPLEPAHVELAFGLRGEREGETAAQEPALPALDLGAGLRVRGRIDRIDVGEGAQAVVYDYKRRGGHSAPPGPKWHARRSLQVALYMRAARDLLDLKPAGGFYQPLTGEDLRARGALAEDVDAPCMKGDRYEPAELDALVEDVVGLARECASLAAAGRLEPRPQTCSPSGEGCMYPTICRCQR